MDHDQNFKNLIIDYPIDALRLFAQKESAALDANVNITLIRQEQLKHQLSDSHRELDVPLLVEWPNGHRAALLFALEHESQSRRFSIHRLAHYCLDLAKLCNTTRVIPVVVFMDKPSKDVSLSLGSELISYLRFSYLACSLGTLDWHRYEQSSNLVARLNLPNMCYHKSDKVAVYASAIKGLLDLEPDVNQRAKYLDFIDMYANLDEQEQLRYQQEYPQEANTMSQFADRFIAQGIEQGLQKGRQQGEAAILLRLLESRFGPLSDQVRSRVNGADGATILQWSERIFAAQRPEDLWR